MTLRTMEARGLLRVPTEVSGILRRVSIGGPHYELHCGVCPVEYVQYVLIPADVGVEDQLAALVEKAVKLLPGQSPLLPGAVAALEGRTPLLPRDGHLNRAGCLLADFGLRASI